MEKIAIVGLACEYPDASNPTELWNNILSKRRSFRKIPKTRLPLEDYFSEDLEEPDKIYSTNAAVIEGYEFDRIKFKVSGSTFRSTDLTHWLALDVATRALEDAGFLKERNLPKSKTAVIVGNTLTGEFSRSEVMRLRWPYVQKVLNDVAISEGWNKEQISGFLLKAEHNYKASFSEVTEDTLAGGLSNTIAGRICNFYDFKGGGYTVDGACSSSLLSVTHGCSFLINHDIDLALVGGIDLSLDPFELIGFAKTKALAKNEMRIYDKRANGFWPGEGCGFAVLMRYNDAVRQGHQIYATINGWGVSSDGKGGLTRPEVEGQTLALERAYKSVEYSISDVQYFEGHGTGTPVGDKVELTTINNARKHADSNVPPAFIGSIKGNIGHTKAAAGIAGLIRATMAIYNRVIPPASSCEDPHEILLDPQSQLRITDKAIPWNSTSSLKAGISSMGFGGINVHITLEGVEGEGKTSLSTKENFIASSFQDSELFVFSEGSINELEKVISDIFTFSDKLSYSELGNLANDLFKKQNVEARYKAAIVASTPRELTDRLKLLLSWLKNGEQHRIEIKKGVYLGTPGKVKVGFLFPGQGAPVKIGSGAIHNRFSIVGDFYKEYPEQYKGNLKLTSNAQPNIVKSSLATIKLLNLFKINGDLGLGHSLGELTALYWAGGITEENVIQLAKVRGNAMAASSEIESGMASILADSQNVKPLLTEDVVISGYNANNQTVISGGKRAIEDVVLKAKENGLIATILPVSHGFHSHYMENGKGLISGFLDKLSLLPLSKTVVSSVTGEKIERSNSLQSLLVNQLTEPVQFIKAMNTLKEEKVDYVIEVGPGNILSKIVEDELNIPAVSIESQSNSIKGLLNCLALSYVLNDNTDVSELFNNRYIKENKLVDKMSFFTNPCERVERKPIEISKNHLESAFQEVGVTLEGIEAPTLIAGKSDPLSILKSFLSEKTELPIEAIKNDYRLLDDLHLNSITVGQVVAQVSNELNVQSPIAMTEYANATVEEVAEILKKQSKTDKDDFKQEMMVESWVGAFHVDRKLTSLKRQVKQKVENNIGWNILIEKSHPFYQKFKENTNILVGSGVIVYLPPEPSLDDISLLLEGVKKAIALQTAFVIIQHGWKTSSSFAKSFYLETGIDTKVINVPLKEESLSFINQELVQIKGFSECFYDSDGTRTTPVLTPIEVVGEAPKNLSNSDVLLFTGGGKGIASECALSLAQETGAKLAIIGRSDPNSDQELYNTIQRAANIGIPLIYEAADVTNLTEVKQAITSIETRLGPITGFTHAAGINNPKLLNNLNLKDFHQTINTKIQGLTNVLECVNTSNLKFLVSFSSVIGRSGLQGESHYGLANEWLTNITDRFSENDISTKCLSIEWSVWSGVGMGQDLGTVESLKRQGITPIPLDIGVRFFKSLVYDLLNEKLPTNTVVVSGRMGNVPTLKYTKSKLPLLRFVEEILVDYPGYEIVSNVHLHPEKDKYLEDHKLDGELLFPAVMGLEAFAQVSSVLIQSEERPKFVNVSFHHPIIVDNKGTTIRIAATKIERNLVKVSLFSETTNFKVPHFEATCIFQQHDKSIIDIPDIEIDFSKKNSVKPLADMYNKFLFQKGRFSKVEQYLRITAKESLAYLEPKDGEKWFNDYIPSRLLLNDPGLTDSVIHSLQACIPHKTLIPMGVEEIIHFNNDVSPLEGKRNVVFGKEVYQENDVHIYNLYVYNQNGKIQDCWLGLKLKEVRDMEHDLKVGPLLSAYLERKFRDAHNCSNFNLVLDEFEPGEENTKEKVVYQLLGESQSVFKRQNGSPVINGKNISFSNHKNYVLGITGEEQVSCDMEGVNSDITLKEWKKMLGPNYFALAEEVSLSAKEQLDISCTRLWTVLECIKKAGLENDQLVALKQIDGSDVHFKVSSSIIGTYLHNDTILSFLVKEEFHA